MRIRMLESMPVTIDGVKTVELEEGDELIVGDGIGADLVESGKAESLDPEPREAELEQKDAGDADENKDAGEPEQQKKPAAARSRKGNG